MSERLHEWHNRQYVLVHDMFELLAGLTEEQRQLDKFRGLAAQVIKGNFERFVEIFFQPYIDQGLLQMDEQRISFTPAGKEFVEYLRKVEGN